MNSCQRFSNKTLPWRGTKFETIFSAESLLKRLENAPTLERQQRPKDLTTEATFMIFLFFIFVGLSAIGTSITVFEYFQRDRAKRKSSTNGNISKKVVSSERKKTLKVSSDEANYMSFKSYLKCFCLLTNGRKLLSTASMENHFECIYGIRFLSILCVILGHVTQSYSITARYNEEMKMYFTTWLAQIIGNIYFVVDVFFVLSGFLNTYSILQDYHRSNGNISWINFYVIRFLRLTPGYMMILGLQATLFTHTGSGPLWPTFDTDPSCRENWWMNLLYINNFQSVYEQCMAWTWYIAADMQLFILSPLFIIPLIRKPSFGYILIGVFMFLSCFITFALTIQYCLKVFGADMWYYFSHREEFIRWQMEYFDLVYDKPYARLSSYLVGIALGRYFYGTRVSKKRINKAILFRGWMVAAFLMYISFFALYKREESLIETALYNGSKDFLFSCSMAWILFVCLMGEGGFMNRILSCKLFLPLSRLSYCVYLIHVSVAHRYHHMVEEISDFSTLSLMQMFFHVFLWSYFISFVATLLFEIPVVKLINQLTKLGKKISV